MSNMGSEKTTVKKRVSEILCKLSDEFDVKRKGTSQKNPFMILVRTVLSQNTNRKNTNKAFNNLYPNYSTPEDFSNAKLKILEKKIKPAGLYKSKSKRLKSISKKIIEDYGGSLEKIINKPVKKARNLLLEMKGVGPKTADCTLLFSGAHDVIPVDTHVERTSKRLGLADKESNLEDVKKQLEEFITGNKRMDAHLLLIELGRKYCKARNPNCDECPVEDLCPQVGL